MVINNLILEPEHNHSMKLSGSVGSAHLDGEV